MSSRRLLRAAAIASVAMATVVGSFRLSAQDAPPPSLDAELVELASRPDAGLVDVWIVFAAQPATRIAAELRPGYERLIDSARAPALAALDRIDPLLPPRDDRAALGVAGIMEREKALLTAVEVDAIRASRTETSRLLQEMRARILSTARPLCETEQAPVAAWVESLPGGEVRTRTVVLDALIVRAPASALPELARTFPGVARIARCRRMSIDLDTSVPTIGASSWTSNGYAGGGATVAIVNSGIDASHPAFTTSSSTAVVTGATVELSNVTGNSEFNDDASSTDDLQGHGTHCAGIVASNDGTYGGVAPGTSLLNAKCFFRTTSNGSLADGNDIVAAVDWALTNGANVLSCSFGADGTSDGTDGFTIYFDAVVDVSGASVAAAAGNAGPSAGSINLPGDGFNVLTVGAFSDNDSTSLSDDSLASFSSRGPTADGRRKPDLSAPGVGTTSTSNGWESGADFVVKSGTSMATPHVAGAMALLLTYGTTWQPEALKALLSNSCRNTSPVSGTPSSSWGCGAMNLGQAYSDRTRVLSATLTPSGVAAHYYKLGSVASGARQTIAWNRAATYYGSTPASGPGSASSLVNLDLYLYDGANGAQSTTSASSVNSVEQTAASSAVASGVLKVLRSGSFPFGQTSQAYALATGANTAVAAAPPTLEFTGTTAPAAVAPSSQFTFTATLKNTGDLRAPTPAVTLSLPSGYSFAGGVNATQTVASLDPFATAGATATASWTVVAGTSAGSSTLSASASSTGFGATFTSASAATRAVVVDGTAPVANAGADVSLPATSASGRSVTLDGSASTDNNSALGLTYAWDTDADGVFNDTPGSATGVQPTVAFALGTRTVTLRVTDVAGNVGTDTVVVQVTDAPPVANAGTDKSSTEGASVSFNGTSSSDFEGAVATYAWNFGDGGTASGATPSHVFNDDGVYTVTLTVTDSVAQTATDTAVVTVGNVAPTANAGADQSGDEGASFSFGGSANDPGVLDALAYSWDFGDGGTATGASPSHVYAQNGSYTVWLAVSDGDGGVGTSSAHVTVQNLAPVGAAGPDASADEGVPVDFAGAATDAGVLDTLTYAWDFGDGAVASSAATTHAYAQDGVYTATLSVTDEVGAVSTSTRTITVANVAPDVALPASLDVDVGDELLVRLEPTDPSSVDAVALSVTWTIVDGADAVVATGQGVDVAWPADRVFDGALVVDVADDHVATQKRTPLHAATPPIVDTLPATLAQDLSPALERQVLRIVLSGRTIAVNPLRLKAAGRRFAAAKTLLSRKGVTSGPLVARLAALAAACATGTAPPPERPFDVPSTLGTIEEIFVAAPRYGFPTKSMPRLLATLVGLRYAERLASPKRIAAAKRTAAAVAFKLPESDARNWLWNSILAQ